MQRMEFALRLIMGALVGGLAAILPLRLAVAADAYDIHVIEPLTGGASFIGKGQLDNLTLLEGYVNKNGGILGRPVHFVFHDNQSSPQLTVQIANEVLAGQPAVILGTPDHGAVQCHHAAREERTGPVLPYARRASG